MSNVSAPRLLAYDAIFAIIEEGAYGNLKLPQLLSESRLEERDRAFCTELVYGSLRWQGKYDRIIAEVSSRPISEMDRNLLNLLRLALHEIYEMRTPDRAVLFEYGEITKKIAGESKLAFLNAVLRKITSQPDLVEKITASLSKDPVALREFTYSHPAWIINSFYGLRKDWNVVDALLASNNTAAAVHAVAYPGRTSKAELISAGGEELRYSPWGAKGSFFINSEGLSRGKLGIQDEGSQIVTELLTATATNYDEKLSWLDMCAGPGGKAALLYTWLQENRATDTFVANEIHQHRADLIASRIPRSVINVGDARDPDSIKGNFDRIIVDAPCTGLGAIRRRPESRWRKSEADLKELITLQRELLDSAYNHLNPGGVLAYVTCSPHLWETKGQVLDLLSRKKDMKPYLVDPIIDNSTLNNKEEIRQAKISDYSIQLWSDVHGTDSMYLALLHKEK